jgi:hypothetical protein
VEPRWSRCLGLAVDTEDEGLYVSGAFRDAAGDRPFVERLSSRGEPDWVRTLVGARGPSAEVAMHGNRVVAVGTFEGAFDFAGQRLQASALTGTSGFAVAFTRAGDARWGRVLGVEATGVAMDRRDGVVVGGYYATEEGVAGQPLPGEPFSFRNLYAVKLDRIDGRLEWARGFPTEYGFLSDVAVDARGASTLTGGVSRLIDFGFGPVAPAPQEDVFILHLGP